MFRDSDTSIFDTIIFDREAELKRLDRLASESPNWSYERFVQISLLCARLGVYLPSAYRPEQIGLDNLYRHATEINQMSLDAGGIEVARVFITDFVKKALLKGKTTTGTETTVQYDCSLQPGRELVQNPSVAMHVHPKKFLNIKGINPLSPTDISSFVLRPRQLADIITMDDYLLMVVKTSATPRFISEKDADKRTEEIASEFITEGKWTTIKEAMRANKEMCLVLGLMLYGGRIGNPLKRIPLVSPSSTP